MNTLSWFLYFAGVANNLQSLLTAACVFPLLGLALVKWVSLMSTGDFPFKWKSWMYLPFVSGFVAAVMPNQTTLYAIAASEMGEKVYQSQQGQEIVSLLEQYIDKQLKEIKK